MVSLCNPGTADAQESSIAKCNYTCVLHKEAISLTNLYKLANADMKDAFRSGLYELSQ